MTDSEALTEARDVMERLIAIAGASLGGNAPLVVSARKLLSALGTAPAVGVKGLEWVKKSGSSTSTAETGFGPVYVVYGSGPEWWSWGIPGQQIEGGRYVNESAAKAAAQADYEQRIRSALVASPAPATAAEIIDMLLKSDRETIVAAAAKYDWFNRDGVEGDGSKGLSHIVYALQHHAPQGWGA